MKEWLLSNEDFDAACGENCDWMMDILWDNGIISEEFAIMHFINFSTDFDVPDCPFCGANDNRHYPLGKNRWKCKKCLRKFSLTSGRYIDNTKMPITYWWRFCWLMAKNKKVNSCAIARDLEITQKSAWLMIDTLKTALKSTGVEMKNGAMEFKGYWNVIKLLMQVKELICKAIEKEI
jgi:Predicted DNA-binding protein containing a Zn-ribbon domain